MKTKKVTRYYCDHCHRGKFSRPAMERHEKVCFHNPHRDCPECDEVSSWVAGNIAILEDGLEALQRKVGCPACVMSAVIQHNKRPENHGTTEFIMYATYKDDINEWRNEKFNQKEYCQ